MTSPSTLTATRAQPPSKARERTLWALQIIAALFFLVASASKFAGAEYNVQVFDKVGIGQWFRYFTAVMELTGAILIVVPRRAALGGLVLSVVMVGALFADLTLLGGTGIPALIALIITSTIVWFRRSTLPAALRSLLPAA